MSTRDSGLARLVQRLRGVGGRRQTDSFTSRERRSLDRRRAPRVCIEVAHPANVCVRIDDCCCPVHDLSVRGFAAELPEADGPALSPGDAVAAVMRFTDTRVEVTVRITNRRERMIGCELLEAASGWHKEISALLDPIFMGQQLREIDGRFLEPDKQGRCPRWFQGGAGCDLFAWVDAQGSHLIQLFFMGQVVEWSTRHGARSGVIDVGVRSRAGVLRPDLFTLSAPANTEALAVARRILNAAQLPDELRQLLVRIDR